MMKKGCLLLMAILHCLTISSQDKKEPEMAQAYAIELSPISPLINIWAVHFDYYFTPRDEAMTGPTFMQIQYDFGHTNAYGVILGYRRFLWKKLHIEYQLWPMYDNFYEKNEDRYYNGFDLWNEFRIGCQFEFHMFKQSFYASFQWPFGFGLYAQNKPDSFLAFQKEERFFYQFPLLFLGIRL